MQVKKGDIVRYVCRKDFDDHDEIPNICAAMVTKVRCPEGDKPESVALHVFTISGGFVDEYVVYDENKSRGTWHWASC